MNAYVEFRFHEDKDLVSFRWKMERSDRLLRGENSTFPEYIKTVSFEFSCKLEELPLAVRGRINMLRLAQDYSYTEGLGYKGKAVHEDDLAKVSFSIKTLELTVYVEDDELEQLRKLCPTILVYKLRN